MGSFAGSWVAGGRDDHRPDRIIRVSQLGINKITTVLGQKFPPPQKLDPTAQITTP